MGMTISFKLDAEPLAKYFQKISSSQSKYHQGLMVMWSVRYRTAMVRRWNKNAGGGGSWPELKPRTIRQRRNKKKGSIKILVDTGVLRDALSPVPSLSRGKPGAFSQLVHEGIRIGFGGPDIHRDAGMSIARLALWHHEGKGRLPVRTVMEKPSPELRGKMKDDVIRVFKRIKRDQGMT